LEGIKNVAVVMAANSPKEVSKKKVTV